MVAGSDTRLGLGLVLAGGLPFALAPALHGAGGIDLPCPFLAATGVPCPLCGGTRAVALAAQGDADALHYGAVWVIVLAALVVAGIAAMTGRRITLRRPVAVVAATLAIAWAWALANAPAIT